MPSSRMTHSLSTPSGVDGSTSTSHSRGGKKLAVRVQMLDDSMTMFQVQVRNETKFSVFLYFHLHCGDAEVEVNDFVVRFFCKENNFHESKKLDQDAHYL
jgi:hypothetical protein